MIKKNLKVNYFFMNIISSNCYCTSGDTWNANYIRTTLFWNIFKTETFLFQISIYSVHNKQKFQKQQLLELAAAFPSLIIWVMCVPVDMMI